jgi:L-histidine Nalpha-methyltransferase / hercynylcysteine S-oxide synthase
LIDIHLVRATGGALTPPDYYPTICNPHSAVPDEYPPLREIIEYQSRVRHRLLSLLKSGDLEKNRLLAEATWIGFEHEVMHLETFLYMLLQSDQILPPPAVQRPNFEQLALRSQKVAVPNEWFTIPSATFTIGLQDNDLSKLPECSFGWDNEKPQRVVSVNAFLAKGRPITNGEYAAYLKVHNIVDIPASWVATTKETDLNDQWSDETDSFASKYAVRTVFGYVSLRWALDWPVMASFDELERYAKWQKCRLPTHEEVRSIYKYAESLKADDVLHVTNGEHSERCVPNQGNLIRWIDSFS